VPLNYDSISRLLKALTKMKQSTKASFRVRKSIPSGFLLMYFAFFICFFFNCYHVVSTISNQSEQGSVLLNIRDSKEYWTTIYDEEGKIWGVTLVTQCDISRTWILEETCRRWNGPIVAVRYVSNEERQNMAFAQDETESITVSPTCKHVTIIPYFEAAPEKVVDGVNVEKYPINELRNIGIDAVDTSHFLMVDVDFVLSSTLRQDIMRNLKYVGVEMHLWYLRLSVVSINQSNAAIRAKPVAICLRNLKLEWRIKMFFILPTLLLRKIKGDGKLLSDLRT